MRVMGFGQLTGLASSVWHYLRPQDGNPVVLEWVASILALPLLNAWWTLFAGGAEKIRDLGLMAVVVPNMPQPRSLAVIKLIAAIAPLFVLVWLYLLVQMDAPLPSRIPGALAPRHS